MRHLDYLCMLAGGVQELRMRLKQQNQCQTQPASSSLMIEVSGQVSRICLVSTARLLASTGSPAG